MAFKRKYTPDMPARVDVYWRKCFKFKKGQPKQCPTRQYVCLNILGISMECLRKWLKQPEYSDLADAIARLDIAQHEWLVQEGLRGFANAKLVILMLCNNHKRDDGEPYTQQSNVTVSGGDKPLQILHFGDTKPVNVDSKQ